MSTDRVPYIPTEVETKVARDNFPSDGATVLNMLDAVSHALNQKKYTEALLVLKSVAMLRPDEPRIYESYGMVYQASHRPEDAKLCFEHALGLNENALYARVNLGEIAWRNHQNAARAKELLTLVIERDASGTLVERAQRTLDAIAKQPG